MKKMLTEKTIMSILGALCVPMLLLPWFTFSDKPEQLDFIKFWTLPSIGMGAVVGLIFMLTLGVGYKILAEKFIRIYITICLAAFWFAQIGLVFIVIYLPYNGWYFYTSQVALFVAYWLIHIGKQWGLKKLAKSQNQSS
jgi:hypothetical protein